MTLKAGLPVNLSCGSAGVFAVVVAGLLACSSDPSSGTPPAGDSMATDCESGSFGPDCAGTCACQNGALCRDGKTGDGTCVCTPGFYGSDCANACDCAWGNPCADGADGDGTCLCKPAFYGSDCSGICVCQNGGQCANGATGDGSCTCPPGTWGPQCMGVCACENGGVCDDGLNGTGACTCKYGYYGATCADACACSYTGICRDGASGDGSCTCQPGFYGPTCANLCACPASRCDDGAAGTGACSPGPYPALGVYTVRTDGSQLHLLLDTGQWQITHVRRQPGSNWLVGTRYHRDPDGNGLAMEVEGPLAYYTQTEVVVFDRTHPVDINHIDGNEADIATCNASWTEDGKLLYIKSDTGGNTSFRRASFTTVPTLDGTPETVPVPTGLLLPVDPDQHGISNASGFIVFPALVNLAASGPPKWASVLWKMPANGEATLAKPTVLRCRSPR